MADETTGYGRPQPGVFDDDRLLACALGLEDDPELVTAAAGDAELAGRLAAMRAEVGEVGAQVELAVPAPADDYADLAGARWAGLLEYFEAPAVAPARRGASLWLRVVAPLAAVAVVALAVGLVAVNRLGGSSSSSSRSMSAAVDSSAGATKVTPAGAPTFAEQIDDFAVVVLARARAASGAFQRFGVVRVLKGKAPDVLRLEVDGHPADRGRLHLLMLRPLAMVDAQAIQEAQAQGPVAAKGAGDGPGEVLQVAYSYQGEPALARELPTGADPAGVTLP